MHKTLRNWEVRRSGAAMVVIGIDVDSGERTKLVNIVAIGTRSDKLAAVTATERDGTQHLLI